MTVHRERGFTLIELIVVMVVIGVLAAIAIPQMTSIKTKSFDSAAKSDLRNMVSTQEAYFAEHQAYVNLSVAAGGRGDFDGDGVDDYRASEHVSLGVTAYTDGFQITSAHSSSPNTWCVNSSSTNATIAPGAIVQAASC